MVCWPTLFKILINFFIQPSSAYVQFIRKRGSAAAMRMVVWPARFTVALLAQIGCQQLIPVLEQSGLACCVAAQAHYSLVRLAADNIKRNVTCSPVQLVATSASCSSGSGNWACVSVGNMCRPQPGEYLKLLATHNKNILTSLTIMSKSLLPVRFRDWHWYHYCINQAFNSQTLTNSYRDYKAQMAELMYFWRKFVGFWSSACAVGHRKSDIDNFLIR